MLNSIFSLKGLDMPGPGSTECHQTLLLPSLQAASDQDTFMERGRGT